MSTDYNRLYMTDGHTIGIDLGTTNTVVATIVGDEAEVIHNDVGDRQTPSVVAFDDDGPFVGRSAKNQAVKAPDRTISSIKRHMGEEGYSVNIDGIEYTPEEISALILKKVITDAEAYLGGEVTECVITVPAYFGNRERQATKKAGDIVGVEVSRIINEPTAACMAYGAKRGGEDNSDAVDDLVPSAQSGLDAFDGGEKVAVYDLGGGTLDTSVVTVSEGIIEVEATGGDNNLGGDDWNQAIVDWMVKTYEEEHGVDVTDDPEAMQRIEDNAIEAKHTLSEKDEADIIIPYLSEEGDFDETLTRETFNDLTEHLLKQSLECCQETLNRAELDTEDIDKVLLVGGSTRMRQVKKKVEEFFGTTPSQEVNPDEVVAMGAAVQAELLGNDYGDDTEDNGVLLIDVTPKSLGIELANGKFDPLIEANETIPVTATKDDYTTASDDQEEIHIQVFEGEAEYADENELLDDFYLTGIEPSQAGSPRFQISFSLDMDGILNVSVEDVEGNNSEDLTIQGVFESTDEEIEEKRKELPELTG